MSNYGGSMLEECKKGIFVYNFRIFVDPAGTQYPDGLLPLNLKSSWCSPFVSDYDKTKKVRNEVDLVDCPDYENPDFEVVDLPEAEAGEEDEEGGEDDD